MATQKAVLTAAAAVDVKTALSLVVGITYSIQARGGPVLVTEQASAPAIGTVAAHKLVPDKESTGSYTVLAGEALFAWGEFGNASLSVTEVS